MKSMESLKSLRGKKLKTQREIADKIGVSRQMYNTYENDISKCELDTIFKIMNALDATEQEFDEFLFSLKQDFMSCEYKDIKEE